MAVTRTFAAGPEQFFQQIDNIIKSHSLRGSESLCKLLQYLAKQSLYHPDAPLKEYQIATEVYGRPADFDPQSDSTIRVQAGRLRLKLAEYYAGEGAADPIVVKIPKGSYHLTFEGRTVEPPGPQSVSALEPSPSSAVVATVPVGWRVAVILLLAGLTISLIVLGSLLWNRKLPEPAMAAPNALRSAGSLAAFWRPFTAGAEEPWVVFSNAAFVGRPETGMRYYNSREDSKSAVYDHYTGVGEVLAIHALDDAFGALGRRILVKRGSLFTLDDVRNNNLIFVGSPSENLSLLDIPGTQEFVFQRVPSGAAARRSLDRQQTSETGRGQRISCESFQCPAHRRLFGRWTGTRNRGRPVRDDSRGNHHLWDTGGSGVCLPAGVLGKIAACHSGFRRGTDQAFRSAGPREDRSRRAGGDRTRRGARPMKAFPIN